MAEEKLQINSIALAWAGAGGGVAEIDEAVASADGNIYGPGPEDDAAQFGYTATTGAISDASTITNVDIEVRVLDDGTAGTRTLDVSLFIGGVTKGTTNTGALSSTMANFQVGNVGWDVDWTKAELDGAEVRLTPRQSGMPGTNQVDLDCAEIIITYTPADAIWDQDRYRAINDDGTESGSTFKAALNTPWNQLPDANVRIRFLVQETGGVAETEGFQLQYSLNGAAYLDVNATSIVVRSSNSPQAIEDGDDTTERLGGAQTYLTDAGGTNGYDDVNGEAGASVFAANEEAEYEFCVQLRSADTKYGDKIELRLVEDGGLVLSAYTNTAKMWADAPAAVLRQVEQFTVSFASGSVAQNFTLVTPLLDVDAAFLVYGIQSSNTGPQIVKIDGLILNTTTVRFERNISGEAITIEAYVAEFTDGVRVERGVITSATFDAAADALVTVELDNIFDITKAFVFNNSEATAGTAYDPDDFYTSFLSTAAGVNSVNGQVGDVTTADGDMRWEVIQYTGCAVQRGSEVMTGASVTGALAPAVDLGKSFLNASHIFTSGSGNMSNRMLNGVFTSTTVVTFDRTATGAMTITDIRWEVVEFTDDVTVEEVIPATFGAAASTKNETITEISALTKAIAFAAMSQMQGKMSLTSSNVVGEASFTAELTTTTNLQLIRGATAGSANAVFYVVDFGATPPAGGLSIPIAMHHHTKHNLVS